MKRKSDFYCDYFRMTGKQYHFLSFIRLFFMHNLRTAFYFRALKNGSRLMRIPLFIVSRKYGIEISPSASIGKGLYLGHPYNITIGSQVVLGENVNLHKGCTIGSIGKGKRAGSPQIGNHVWIGINATVVGGITIGNDVLIAPNAFVNFDVPGHSVVLGNPGVIHHKDHATEDYLNNLV